MIHIEHLIVGGGVAGIYLGLQLHQKQIPFVLFEKSTSNHVGKIFTKELMVPSGKDGRLKEFHFELGPSVFHTNQPKLHSLLQQLNLDTSIKVLDTVKETHDVVYPGFTPEQASLKFQKLKRRLHNASKFATFETIDQLAQRVLPTKEYAMLKSCWNCWYENNQMNAKAYFESEDKEGKYCILQGGLQQITNQAKQLFQHAYRQGVTILSIQQIDEGFLVQTSQLNVVQDYFVKHLYLCLSIDDYASIRLGNLTKVKEYLQHAKSVSSMRFYTIFKEPIQHIPDSITGKIESRWILKYNKRIYLGPYVDGPSADYMSGLTVQQIQSKVCFDLKQSSSNLFDSVGAYWKDAFTVLSPSYFMSYLKPFQLQSNLFCTTLPDPLHQAWMEGHLFDLPPQYISLVEETMKKTLQLQTEEQTPQNKPLQKLHITIM